MPNCRTLSVYSQPGSLAATVHQTGSAVAKTKKLMKKAFLSKKIALFAFLIPFVLATVGYHCVYVCDASARSQWIGTLNIDIHDKAAIDKAVEQEENRRWSDGSAWGVHALVLGLPAGLLSLVIVFGSSWAYSMLTRRQKVDDSV